LNEHYFILGKDWTAMSYYSGSLAYVTLHYGPGSFLTRPFEVDQSKKNDDGTPVLPDPFFYNEGVKRF
jgi:hypothetical protein